MAYSSIKSMRKLTRKIPSEKSVLPNSFALTEIGYDDPFSDGWQDCILLIMERHDELRQFLIDQFADTAPIKSKGKMIRNNMVGLRHVEHDLRDASCAESSP